MKFTPSSEQALVHKHKLPPKLLELLQSVDHSTVIGFGSTPEQRDFMLLSALLNSQNTSFFQALKHDLDEYFFTLSDSLLVTSDTRSL